MACAYAGEELLILHADAGVRKITARSLPSSASQPSPAEIKFASVMSNLMTVTCRCVNVPPVSISFVQ